MIEVKRLRRKIGREKIVAGPERCDERADKREQNENENDGHEEIERDSQHHGLASDEQFAFAWRFLFCRHRFVPFKCSRMQLGDGLEEPVGASGLPLSGAPFNPAPVELILDSVLASSSVRLLVMPLSLTAVAGCAPPEVRCIIKVARELVLRFFAPR